MRANEPAVNPSIHFYEAYLWESTLDLTSNAISSWQSSSGEQNDAPSVHSREGRLFEDPLYLTQYSLMGQNPQNSKAVSVENSAFLTAENETHLRTVMFVSCLHFTA